jgi:hypothetical protein
MGREIKNQGGKDFVAESGKDCGRKRTSRNLLDKTVEIILAERVAVLPTLHSDRSVNNCCGAILCTLDACRDDA